MTITIYYDSDYEMYSVYVNGEVLLECLGESEVEALTLKEIDELYRNAKGW